MWEDLVQAASVLSPVINSAGYFTKIGHYVAENNLEEKPVSY
jgi:hypothetical protein